MLISLILFSFNLFAALDTGDGSDGACNFSGAIVSRVWNCTTFTMSGAVTIASGTVPLVIKVKTGNVVMGNSFDLSGGDGPVPTNSGDQVTGLAGGGNGGAGYNLGTPQTKGGGTTPGGCGHNGADLSVWCDAGVCGAGGGAGGTNGTVGSDGIDGVSNDTSHDGPFSCEDGTTLIAYGAQQGLAASRNLVDLSSTLVGGSGGGTGGLGYVGDGTGASGYGGPGGAGGGALKIITNGSVTINANINVSGGDGATSTGTKESGGGGGGAGGTIYLVSASTITVTSTLNLSGGAGGAGAIVVGTTGGGGDGGDGGLGRLRFDTPNGSAGVDISGATITGGVTPEYFVTGTTAIKTVFSDTIASGCGSVELVNNHQRVGWILSFFVPIFLMIICRWRRRGKVFISV